MRNILHSGGTIVLFCDPVYQAYREKIAGVYAAATRHGWQVFHIDRIPPPSEIRSIAKMIDPIGFIVEPSNLMRTIDRQPFGRRPVVLLGRDHYRERQILDCSCQEAHQPVQAAVGTLLRRSDLASFAYVGHPSKDGWSLERGRLFRSRVPKQLPFFEYGGKSPEEKTGHDEIVGWLRSLPRPVGLLLATDHLAPSIFNAIHKADIAIPDEMAVVSIDDIPQICLNVKPTLTSVVVDFFKAGENAVELIRRRLADPNRPAERLTYGVISVSHRASTRKPCADKRVTRAIDFIENNIAANISSRHVLSEMGCGRRQGEQIFRLATGMSILQSIQACRIRKAMSLLANGTVPIEEIPSFCGYDSPAFFKTLFRRATGKTMREWRSENARHAAS